jgi:hypothetical protein
MFSLMLQVIKNPQGIKDALVILERNPEIISNAIQLIDTVQETSKDGKFTRNEHNQLTKDFWKFVKSINNA